MAQYQSVSNGQETTSRTRLQHTLAAAYTRTKRSGFTHHAALKNPKPETVNVNHTITYLSSHSVINKKQQCGTVRKWVQSVSTYCVLRNEHRSKTASMQIEHLVRCLAKEGGARWHAYTARQGRIPRIDAVGCTGRSLINTCLEH